MAQASISDWVGENYRTYFANATSTRDYRVQMRGSKAVVFFSLYLGLLITVAWLVYTNSISNGTRSIMDAQQNLKSFYDLVLGALGFMVSVVPPVMAATSIITEKHRHSFDLVFSAPVTAKYYLVGKLISSFRYTWMLLVLALPITAACVVLGGASWTDVLAAYFMLSVSGVLISAFAVSATIVTTKPGQAVLLALLVSVVYNVGFGMIGSFAAYGVPQHGASMPAIGLLFPFLVGRTAMTSSTIFGIHMLNIIPATVYAALICKFLLVCSGTQLMPYSKRTAVSVRIHCLLFAIAIPLLLVYSVTNTVPQTDATAVFGATHTWSRVGVATGMYVFLLSLTAPISCVSWLSENRLRPNGNFKLRHAFDGTPAGNLPYFLLLTACIFGAVFVAGKSVGIPGIPDFGFWSMMVYSSALWVFGWGISRWTSGFGRSLQQAQGLAIAAIFTVYALPAPIISIMSEPGSDTSTWTLHLLRPFGLIEVDYQGTPLIYATILISCGALMACAGNRRMKQQFNELQAARAKAA